MPCPSSVKNCPDRQVRTSQVKTSDNKLVNSTTTTINGIRYTVKPKAS